MRWLVPLIGLAALAGCGEEDEGGATAGATSFEAVPWVLASGPSATFEDGTVAGSTGCNRFTASYTQDGTALEIGTPVTTRKACPPPADATERAYLAALERVAGWRREGDELTLVDGDGKELLRFREASPVGAWKATMVRQRDAVASPLPETDITAEFGDDGALTGSAGCNAYQATYSTDGARITIGETVATDMACAAPILEQEQAYLSALRLAASWSVEGPTLSLLTAEDTFVATYERAP